MSRKVTTETTSEATSYKTLLLSLCPILLFYCISNSSSSVIPPNLSKFSSTTCERGNVRHRNYHAFSCPHAKELCIHSERTDQRSNTTYALSAESSHRCSSSSSSASAFVKPEYLHHRTYSHCMHLFYLRATMADNFRCTASAN